MTTTVVRDAAGARTATLLVFGINGFVFASWMARIPDVRTVFALDPGQLGLVLVALSIGSLTGLPMAGRIAQRVGVVNTVRGGILVATLGLLLAAAAVAGAGHFLWVMPGLALSGFGIGIWDVAQNLEGSTVERAVRRAIMPWFHASFSGGTVLGALLGAGAITAGIPVVAHITVVALGGALASLLATRAFLPAEATGPAGSTASAPRGRSPWTEPRTLLVGLMAMAAAFTEGTANDWLAVAFIDGHHLAGQYGVLALAVFLTAMTLARVTGTLLLDRYGRVVTLRVLFAAAGLGSVLVVFGSLPVAFVGAAVWGAGASLGFPVAMSAASDDPARAAVRISVVSTMGYTAFLAGPPLLGLLGNQVGVLHALLAVGAAGLLALLIVPASRPL